MHDSGDEFDFKYYVICKSSCCMKRDTCHASVVSALCSLRNLGGRNLHKKFLIYMLLINTALMGCSAVRHGWTTVDYKGQLLSAKSGPGAERLKIEMNYNRWCQVSILQGNLKNGDLTPPITTYSSDSFALYF